MGRIRPRSLFKGWFFASRVDLLLQPVTSALDRLLLMGKLSRWIRAHRQLPFNDYYTLDFDYERREELYRFVLEREGLDAPVDYLEFGVAAGTSFRWWTGAIRHPEARFYGFDTFTGLPEDWGPFKKGSMSAGNRPPDLNDSRCTFYSGLFQQTLHPFLRDVPLTRRKIVHLDADLYSATAFVLGALHPHLRPGDVLFFDEFNVPHHEFRAFSEFIQTTYREYEVLGAVNNYYGVAVKLR